MLCMQSLVNRVDTFSFLFATSNPGFSMLTLNVAYEKRRRLSQCSCCDNIHCRSSHNLSINYHSLHCFGESCKIMGMKLSGNKSKLQVSTKIHIHLRMLTEPIEIIDSFQNLGSFVIPDYSIYNEIGTRISKSSMSLSRLYTMLLLQWMNRISTKLKIFRHLLCQHWTMYGG